MKMEDNSLLVHADNSLRLQRTSSFFVKMYVKSLLTTINN